MAFELPESIYSPQLLEMVIFEIEQYNAWYRENTIKTKVGVKTDSQEPNHSQETMLVIKAWQDSNKTAEATLENLVNVLKGLKLPVIHVTLATMPNHTQRMQLIGWFQGLTSPRPLILFSADRSIGGGMMVRTPNHIYDLSFRQKFEAARANLSKVVVNA